MRNGFLSHKLVASQPPSVLFTISRVTPRSRVAECEPVSLPTYYLPTTYLLRSVGTARRKEDTGGHWTVSTHVAP